MGTEFRERIDLLALYRRFLFPKFAIVGIVDICIYKCDVATAARECDVLEKVITYEYMYLYNNRGGKKFNEKRYIFKGEGREI